MAILLCRTVTLSNSEEQILLVEQQVAYRGLPGLPHND